MGRSVTPDYFRALNIPIVRGRDFAEQDRTGNEREVILSRLLAARLFPDEDPIGKRFESDGRAADRSHSRRRGRQRKEQWAHRTK